MSTRGRPPGQKISIIMPVLNEARILRANLGALRLSGNEELIVADGGSDDGSMRIAREFTRHVVASSRGRARQMNAGAGEASGDVFLFLHADCRLPEPETAFATVRSVLDRPGVAAGAFDLAIDHPARRFRLIEWGANLRSRVTRVPYGDQGLFLRREAFERAGGFADIPLMEDVEIAGRLKREGRIVFVRPPLVASPRRWLAEGALHTTLRDWRIALAYSLLGVAPSSLARHYRDVR